MKIFQHRLQRREIEASWAGAVDTKIATRDLTAESRALEVKESGGTFEVGQRVGVDGDQALEFGAGSELKAQRVEELRVVALEDPEQVGDVPAPVIDHLGLRARRAAQKDAAHADERLGIGRAGGGVDDGADALGEVALAALSGGDRRG